MRTCNYIGNPPMFHSRVSGVGTVEMKGARAMFDKIAPSGPPSKGTIFFDPKPRLQVCPPVCPEGYVPPSQRPSTIPMVEPATGGSALPLVIGAALLLLS